MSQDIRKNAAQILRGPIGQPTRWSVISGPPSSGKTTVIRELARAGFAVARDVSRDHLEAVIHATGGTKHSVRSSRRKLQMEILDRMLAAAARLPRERPIVFDYALPDNIAFWEVEGLRQTADVWRAAVLFRFHRVFLFEALPFVDDHVRTEVGEHRDALAECLRRSYSALGYCPIWVPAGTKDERVDLIRRHIDADLTDMATSEP